MPQKVVISSEWNYVPFIYPLPTSLLKDFIFVGLPASESQNALLVPIAGHELGHAVWRRTKVAVSLSSEVRKAVIEQVKTGNSVQDRWLPAYSYALRQAEEVFCDIIGLWLFGAGFLHAFRYLLAPDEGSRGSAYYPSTHDRAEFLTIAAARFGDAMDPDFVDLFPATATSTDPHLLIADAATRSLVHDLIDRAEAHCAGTMLQRPTTTGEASALTKLRAVSPVAEFGTIADVVNAAWSIRLSLDKWKIPGVDRTRKIYVLNDLVFKSFEVSEWKELSKSHGSKH
jgi:hypothetical protein